MRGDMRCGDVEATLRMVNRVLLIILIASICSVAIVFAVHAAEARGDQGELPENLIPQCSERVEVPSAFVYEEKSYDIYPGRAYVVYTNYACPHCAELYFGAHSKGIAYTSRFLLIEDGEGNFATQDVVSAYMLKLYRCDAEAFDVLEAELFGKQMIWTGLDEEGLIDWLNERSGQTWMRVDLTEEYKEVARIEREAPGDLPFIPGVFQDGVRCDDVMYDLLDEGAAVLASRGEG